MRSGIYTPERVIVGHAAGAEFAGTFGPVLRAGLDWLLRTLQPDEALCSHLGMRIGPVAGRSFALVPSDTNRGSVVVVQVTDQRYTESGINMRPANPLGRDELDRFASLLGLLGAPVLRTWNGFPAHTGSLELRATSHWSLLHAVGKKRAGCREHPSAGTFCDCGWKEPGFAALIRPAWPAGAAR